jgi:hypothetical protein
MTKRWQGEDPCPLAAHAPTDHSMIKRETHLDGKGLLHTCDLTLSPDDLAAAYPQLTESSGGQDFKALGLRPVFHYRDDRIHATSRCAGWRCYSFGSSRTPPKTPGATSATNSTGWPWSPATGHGRVAQRSTLSAGHQPSPPRSICPNPRCYFDFTTTSGSQVSPRRAPVVTRPVRPSVDGTRKMTPARQGDSRHRRNTGIRHGSCA